MGRYERCPNCLGLGFTVVDTTTLDYRTIHCRTCRGAGVVYYVYWQ